MSLAMGSVSFQKTSLACMLVAQCLALNVRQIGLNATTTASPEAPLQVAGNDPDSNSAGRVIVQTSVTGFENVAATTSIPEETSTVDIWDLIRSELDLENPNNEWTLFTPHFEVAETEFAVATGGALSSEGDAFMTAALSKENIEGPTAGASVGGPTAGASVIAPTATITNSGETLTPVPQSQVVIGTQTLTAGGSTATWVENDATTTIRLDSKGTPILVLGDRTSTVTQITPAPTVIEGQTLSQGGLPITIGSGFSATTLSLNNEGKTIAVVEGATSTLAAPKSQVVKFGSNVTATIKEAYQYVVGGSTLDMNHPVTISNTVISLKTNAIGYTLLVAGDKTTTLASPAQLTSGLATTVKDGTTQYIIGSQTLAPGHPITVDGTSMAITTSAGSTILVIGNMTTTVAGASTTSSRPQAATAGAPTTATSSKGGAAQMIRWDAGSSFVVAFGLTFLGLG